MKVLHVVPEINEANGVYQVARDLAREDGGKVVDARRFQSNNPNNRTIEQFSEVWVHGMWLPREWLACWRIVRLGNCSIEKRPKLVRMTHGSLSPIYLEKQGKWKKRLAGPIERWLLRRADRVVVTCEAEKEWVRAYEPRAKKIEIVDLKRFFALDRTFVERASCPFAGPGGSNGQDARSTGRWGSNGQDARSTSESLHVLYLGRRHPLKGVEFLERAVGELVEVGSRPMELRIVSDHFGEELERDWEWCDVLVLPTLSENFGRVVAEALERGKRVVTTDGAPAWAPPEAAGELKSEVEQWRERLVYLKGYRDGTDEERVRMLKEALKVERVR